MVEGNIDTPEIADLNAAADNLETYIEENRNNLSNRTIAQLERVIKWMDAVGRQLKQASDDC